jgi:hypothetical protein
MEKNTNSNDVENYEDEDINEQRDEIDFDELTSHKIDKNVLAQKRRKRLIVILEHA